MLRWRPLGLVEELVAPPQMLRVPQEPLARVGSAGDKSIREGVQAQVGAREADLAEEALRLLPSDGVVQTDDGVHTLKYSVQPDEEMFVKD